MGFRNKFHMHALPDPEGTGEGDKTGDGGNGGTGGNPEGGNKGAETGAGGSTGTGGSGGNPPGNQNPQGGNQDVPIDQLPEGWQKHIKELRGENQERRTRQADYDKYKGFYDSIQGVVSPESQKSPEQLQKDIEAERQRARDSDLKLAIYQTAGEHGADPQALLDSASFLTDARKLDTFDGVGDLIKNAVEKNSRLRASGGQQRQRQQAPGSSGSTEFPGGAGNGQQLTRDDLKNMKPEAIEKARVEGRLKNLMGG